MRHFQRLRVLADPTLVLLLVVAAGVVLAVESRQTADRDAYNAAPVTADAAWAPTVAARLDRAEAALAAGDLRLARRHLDNFATDLRCGYVPPPAVAARRAILIEAAAAR